MDIANKSALQRQYLKVTTGNNSAHCETVLFSDSQAEFGGRENDGKKGEVRKPPARWKLLAGEVKAMGLRVACTVIEMG